jgi:hypothetical protein
LRALEANGGADPGDVTSARTEVAALRSILSALEQGRSQSDA